MREKEQPIEAQISGLMNDIGKIIGQALNEHTRQHKERYGFALLMFGMGGDSRMNYISNANRADMLVALKEFIARVEGRYEEVDFTKKQ